MTNWHAQREANKPLKLSQCAPKRLWYGEEGGDYSKHKERHLIGGGKESRRHSAVRIGDSGTATLEITFISIDLRKITGGKVGGGIFDKEGMTHVADGCRSRTISRRRNHFGETRGAENGPTMTTVLFGGISRIKRPRTSGTLGHIIWFLPSNFMGLFTMTF